ncbi:dermonecrotic toxin domain-containing protein [Pseudomonas sp. BBP2017]|uniref:dermonecrotic toxin domain-containing protein n=1 Tax=Pseudomonas sp. BBP2017 TaxID=2109731 RepID=UPI000D11D4D4|nr:DUF6543 domain-containing protein [Pseudomonas sp. BBP2017]PSS56399.1 mannosyltransferase [Pseudomonas sp. BBP2017]
MSAAHVNAAGVQYVREHLVNFPRPDRAAADTLKQLLSARGISIDPDQLDVVTLHYQVGKDYGWTGIVAQRLSLTQAMLSNWQAERNNNAVPHFLETQQPSGSDREIRLVPTLRPPAHEGAQNYYVFSGVFRRTHTEEYSDKTRIDLPIEVFERFVWNLDFHTVYKAMLKDYWSNHLESYGTSAKLNFLAACNQQAGEGKLSRAGTQLAWRAAGVLSDGVQVQVRPLNVYGYVATDLLCLKGKGSPLMLLYIPGNTYPLHEFTDQGQLQDWFAQQCKDPEKRQALMAHFAHGDEPDGLSFSGLATALEGLAVYPRSVHLDSHREGFTTEGVWAPRTYINYKMSTYSPALSADLFRALAERQRRRSYSDADSIITSDSEVSKARWRGYLNSAINYLSPLALIVPELAPLFALGGIAQFGLGLDQAINGKHQQQQAAGVGDAVFGLLNAVPLVHALVTERPLLFRFKSERFVAPSRINGQLGYPMGPDSPPRLPNPDLQSFFVDADAIPPLPEANSAVAGAVIRLPEYDGNPDRLEACIDGYNSNVVYDLERDAFLLERELNEVTHNYYIAPESGINMQPLKNADSRLVTDEMRMASLRALGVDLRLPIELPPAPAEPLQPIPKRVMGIWVGDRVISDDLLANIGRNAEQLKNTEYAFQLYLSNANTAAFEENLRLLAEHAPSLEVLPLEQQPFFEQFRQSPYHAQYQAALEGNGSTSSNPASAADILRYRLLDHQGGLYMDVDDTLLAPGEHPYTHDGNTEGLPGEALDQVDLSTAPDGLLLFPPASNQKMGMNWLYNNSLIGSHANNPTLTAISEEILTRFRSEPEFYASKPSLSQDPQAFYRYANKLCRLTGPGVLTDIVDRRLPALHTLRQINNLFALRQVNAVAYLDSEHYLSAVSRLLPLDRIAKIGGAQTWAK